MCGRFVLEADIDQLEHDFDVKFDDATLQTYRKNYNTAPRSYVCVVLEPDGTKVARSMHWSLLPRYMNSFDDLEFSTFNARSETLKEKKTFSVPWNEGKRCIIPFNGYYEWKKPEKIPYYFSAKDGSMLGFAGIYDIKRIKEPGSLIEMVLQSCTIITCEPNEVCKEYHNRMPVIIPREGSYILVSPEVDRLMYICT